MIDTTIAASETIDRTVSDETANRHLGIVVDREPEALELERGV